MSIHNIYQPPGAFTIVVPAPTPQQQDVDATVPPPVDPPLQPQDLDGTIPAALLPAPAFFVNPPIAMDYPAFDQKFPHGTHPHVATDKIDSVDNVTSNEWIRSIDIADCITLFAAELDQNDNNRIEEITCYHVESGEELNVMVDRLNFVNMYGSDKTFLIYLIGGTEETIQADALYDTILTAIDQIFQNKHIYTYNLLNLNADEQHKYVDAALDVTGQLTYSRHSYE